MPLSIILSTSFPDVALVEYRKKGKLDLQKGDAVRVFKRYNHWSYVGCCLPPKASKREGATVT